MCLLGRALIGAILYLGFVSTTVAEQNPITQLTTDFTKPEKYERYPGGSTTHTKLLNSDAFSFPSNNMSFERQLDFAVGNRLFTRNWVSAPSSSKSNDGIGPLFNARSCQACHFKDGRGHLPISEQDDAESLILKLGYLVKEKEKEKKQADPIYGQQLQDHAVHGVLPEGKLDIEYQETTVMLKDQSKVVLRKPLIQIKKLAYGELHKKTQLSPRIAPPMIGLGLLAMIPEESIVSQIDEQDANQDGISGKANYVFSQLHQSTRLGRFGWKASMPTIQDQVSEAFFNDMGLSTPLKKNAYGDCTEQQKECTQSLGKSDYINDIEITQNLLDAVTFYSKHLAVPQRRDYDKSDVLQGKKLFYDIGCVACHTPKYITRTESDSPELSRQLIWPYSDLLLHDMGPGLADNLPEGNASGQEWRTPPLWGIGLTALINKEYGFLHDGRARTVLEAILWHGGEAENSKQQVINLSTEQRRQLLSFINSL